MKTWKRTHRVRQVVIHTNEGPEIPITSAESLGRYLTSIDGGYHHVHDDDSTLTLAGDDVCVAGAKGGDCNEVAIHHCIIGRADQTPAEWDDDFSRAAIARCAQAVARDCTRHGINAIRITGYAVRDATATGICGHGDITAAWRVKGGHTDPGPQFPWADFIAQVRAHLEWEADMPKPTDCVGVLSTEHGAWKLFADGGVHTIRGDFWGSYWDIPPAGRQGSRYFAAITRRIDAPHLAGYTIVGNDGSTYTFGEGITYQ